MWREHSHIRRAYCLLSTVSLSAMLGDLLTLVAEGHLDPMLSRTLALGEVSAALGGLANRHTQGKLVHTFR